jgi:hypothetical protein
MSDVAVALVVCTILFLFFTNALFRKAVLGIVVLGAVVGGGVFAWYEYVSLPRQEAERRHALAAARKRLADEEEALARDRDANRLIDGRWLFLTTDTGHRRYFIDMPTVQADGDGVLAWVRTTPCPSFFAEVDSSSCPPGPQLPGSEPREETTRMWFSCTERLLSSNTEARTALAPQPGTMGEFLLNWFQASHFCAEVKAQLHARARPVVPQAHPTPGLAVTGLPDSDTGGMNGVRTEDGRYAYVVKGAFSKIMVKASRALSEEERRGLMDRVKVQCPSSWVLGHCSGRFADGASWSSEPYFD